MESLPGTAGKIEINESIRNAPEIDLKELIGKLRQAGFTVALDDFGTEYVNLSLLSSVEFDVLKLDKTWWTTWSITQGPGHH